MESPPSHRGSWPPKSLIPDPKVFVFEGLEFDEERWELRDNGKVVDVPPKVMQTLGLLLRNRERVVSNDELLAALWPDVTVTEASLTKAIRIARKVLGDDGDSQRCIRTTRGRGYRFVAEVREVTRLRPPTLPPPSFPPLAMPRHGAQPFVGRDAELGELLAALDGALAGRASAVLVSGHAGMGKTRLIEVFAERAEASGARVLFGRACEEGGAPELWPFIQILRGVRDAMVPGEPEHADIVRLVEKGGGDDAPHQPLDEARRFRVFEAIQGILSRAARERPLVLVLEDLHAADASSLALARFLTRELRDAGIVILGSYRPLELASADAPASFKKLVERAHVLPLTGLSEDATRSMMTAALGRAPLSKVVSRVHHVTDGNPLFIAEVARRLAATTASALDRAGSGDVDIEIPERIVEAIRARFESLPVATVELLSAAAVIGRQFEIPVLTRVSGRAQSEMAELLGPAIQRGIVVSVKDTIATCQFAHILQRDVLYEALPLARRAELHLRTAEVLEGLGVGGEAPSAARLAHHFLRAELGHGGDKAVHYSATAGRGALQSFAFEEAARHFTNAIDALRFASGREGVSTDLLLSLGHAERLLGDYDRSRDTLRRALALARRSGDATRFSRVVLDYAQVKPESGEANQGLIALLEEALVLLDRVPADAADREHQKAVSLVEARLATCIAFAGRKSEGVARSDRALALARALEDPMVLAHALHTRHWLLWRPGTARERLAIASEMVKLEVPNLDGLPTMEARLCEITDLLELGDAVALWRAVARYSRVAETLRDPAGLYNVRVFEVMRSLLEGRFEDAERLAHESAPVGMRIHPENARTFYGTHIWWTRVEQGQGRELESLFRDRVESLPGSTVLRAGLLRLYVEIGALEDVRREAALLTQGGFAAFDVDWSLLSILAHLAVASSALDDARLGAATYAALAPFADSHVVLGPAIVYLGPVSFYLGHAAHAARAYDDAVTALERAVAEGKLMGARPLVVRAESALSRALLARAAPGDRVRAHALAVSALALARELGMERFVGEGEALVREASGP